MPLAGAAGRPGVLIESSDEGMDQFVIEGGHPLRGDVTPAGNKNAALPILAACLLTAEPVTLRNIPRIADVEAMRQIICQLGAQVEEIDPHTWRLHTPQLASSRVDAELARRIRASALVAGPVLARYGEINLPPPGGDVIGRRRIDTHLLALGGLGAAIRFENNSFQMQADGLTGGDLLLDEASVTATENAIMAASVARGTTTIRNAASEPHVQDLCHFLNHLGARVEQIGSNTLTIHGVEALHGGDYSLGPDYLEVVSFIGAAAVTGGEVRIRNAGVAHLDMIRLVFKRLGVHWEADGDDILVPARQPLAVVPDVGGAVPEVKTNVWPAFPTDLTSIAITVATQATGTILFHDWMFSGRMYFTDKLVGMGARIILCDPYRCLVQGPNYLQAEQLESPDIRAGMSLLLAALCARGQSVIRNIRQIERGYENIDLKLSALGAHIERVEV
jgi:UDP-N-acetylglucosamine 1-carboxyvinyltransferase